MTSDEAIERSINQAKRAGTTSVTDRLGAAKTAEVWVQIAEFLREKESRN